MTRGCVEFREAIRLDPDDSWLYVNLAEYLQRKGDYAGALAIIRDAGKGLKLVADPWHSAEWLAEIEPMAALAGRLPAILKGEDRPRDVAERLDLAQICLQQENVCRLRPVLVRGHGSRPEAGDDRQAQHATTRPAPPPWPRRGKTRATSPPDDAARVRLRLRARDWLRAELAAWSKRRIRQAAGPGRQSPRP